MFKYKFGCLLVVFALANTGEAVARVPVSTVAANEQAQLLQNKDPELARNKRVVYDYRRLVVQGGQLDKLPEYVDSNYKVHNAAMAPGRDGLANYLKQQPQAGAGTGSVNNLVDIVAEGNLVVLSTLDEFSDPQDRDVSYSYVLYEVYRMSGGKIVEGWLPTKITAEDIAAQRAAGGRLNMPPQDRARLARLAGVVPLDQQQKLLESRDPALAYNKRRVFDCWRTVIASAHFDQAPEYMDVNYIQHNPSIPSGRQEIVDFLSARLKPKPVVATGLDSLVNIIAERDIVVLMQADRTPDSMAFDVLRVTDGKVSEHWDSARLAADVFMMRRGQSQVQPAVSPPPPNSF